MDAPAFGDAGIPSRAPTVNLIHTRTPLALILTFQTCLSYRASAKGARSRWKPNRMMMEHHTGGGATTQCSVRCWAYPPDSVLIGLWLG